MSTVHRYAYSITEIDNPRAPGHWFEVNGRNVDTGYTWLVAEFNTREEARQELRRLGEDEGWRVCNDAYIPLDLARLYGAARERVLTSRHLRDRLADVLPPSLVGDESHLVWALRAKVDEILKWLEAQQ